MLKGLSFLFVCLIVISAHGQYFEGYAQYQVNIISTKKDNDEKVNMLYSLNGRDLKWYFKGGNYKKQLSSEIVEEATYDPVSNTINELTRKGGTYTSKSASDDPGTLEALPFVPDKFQIIGHECKRADFKASDFKLEVSYSGKFRLESRLYKNHKADYLDEIFRKVKAVPLKMVYTYDDLTIVYRAVEIKRVDLDSTFFDLKKTSNEIKKGVKNNLDFTSVSPLDKSFSIEVPAWMEHTNDLHKDASVDVQYRNDDKYLYMTVVNTAKSKMDANGESFNDYVEFVEKNLKANIMDPSLRQITAAPINDMEIRYYELTGYIEDIENDDEIELYYQVGIVKGKKNYYQIVTWTEMDEKGPLVPQMKKIIRSLAEN